LHFVSAYRLLEKFASLAEEAIIVELEVSLPAGGYTPPLFPPSPSLPGEITNAAFSLLPAFLTLFRGVWFPYAPPPSPGERV